MATIAEQNFKDEDFYKCFAKIYTDITLNNKAPWLKECIPERGLAYNPMTGIVFPGINSLILEMRSAQKGFKDSRWLSLDEIDKAGLKVKEGEFPTPIAYLNKFVPMVDVHPSSGERLSSKEQRSRYYFMYNVEQIKGINLSHDETFIIGKNFTITKIQNAIENCNSTDARVITEKLLDSIVKKVPIEMQNIASGIAQYRMAQEIHIPYKPILRQEQIDAFKTIKLSTEHLMITAYTCEVEKTRMFSKNKQLENGLTRTVERSKQKPNQKECENER